MKKSLIIFIISLLILNISLVSASCVKFSTEELFERSSIIFSGKANEINIVTDLQGLKEQEAKFEVYEVFKGPDLNEFVVSGGIIDLTTSFSFVEGNEYLVYAKGEIDDLSTNVCAGTKPLSILEEPKEKGKEANLIPNPAAQEEIKEIEAILKTDLEPPVTEKISFFQRIINWFKKLFG